MINNLTPEVIRHCEVSMLGSLLIIYLVWKINNWQEERDYRYLAKIHGFNR